MDRISVHYRPWQAASRLLVVRPSGLSTVRSCLLIYMGYRPSAGTPGWSTATCFKNKGINDCSFPIYSPVS